LNEVIGQLICPSCPGEEVVLGRTEDNREVCVNSILGNAVARDGGAFVLDCGHRVSPFAMLSAQEWVRLTDGSIARGGPLPLVELGNGRL